jgi:hypothetical protein
MRTSRTSRSAAEIRRYPCTRNTVGGEQRPPVSADLRGPHRNHEDGHAAAQCLSGESPCEAVMRRSASTIIRAGPAAISGSHRRGDAGPRPGRLRSFGGYTPSAVASRPVRLGAPVGGAAMAKLDITQVNAAVRRLLEQTENPRHRISCRHMTVIAYWRSLVVTMRSSLRR